MATRYRLASVRRWQAKALRAGGTQISISTVEWDISGKCTDAVRREIVGQREHTTDADGVKSRRGGHAQLNLWVRCRKCEKCLQLRRYQWERRAEVELRRAKRTWFVSFTIAPEFHHQVWMEHITGYRKYREVYSRRKCKETGKWIVKPTGKKIAGKWVRGLREKGHNPFEFSEDREYVERCRALGVYLTDYWKRLRKNSGSEIRYLLVSERHKEKLAGLPHFHAFIHEHGETPCTYRDVTREWKLGFISAKLVDLHEPHSVRYVCKYIGKDALCRIRNSQDYGAGSDTTVALKA